MNYEKVNKKVVIYSIVFSTIIGLIGVLFGIYSNSEVIAFDGIKNLIGGVFTIPSIFVIYFIAKSNDDKFPYGKEALEPLVAIIQYVALIYICLDNLASSWYLLFHGGNKIGISSSLIYGGVSTLLKILSFAYLKRITKNQSTAISEAEVIGWLFEALIGVGILVGFITNFIFDVFGLVGYMPYVDPLLTVILSLIFGVIPVFAIIGCVKELMIAQPSKDIVDEVTSHFFEVSEYCELKNEKIKVGKIGGKLVVEIACSITSNSPIDSVLEQEIFRNKLELSFLDMPYNVKLIVNFNTLLE